MMAKVLADAADAGGEAIHAVDEVDDVDDRHEPQDRQRVLRGPQVLRAEAWERDVVDGQARRDGDHRAGHLGSQLHDRAELPDVVGGTDQGDEGRPDDEAPGLTPGGQEPEHRDEEADEDRHSAKQGRRAGVDVPPGRGRDGAHPVCEHDHQRDPGENKERGGKGREDGDQRRGHARARWLHSATAVESSGCIGACRARRAPTRVHGRPQCRRRAARALHTGLNWPEFAENLFSRLSKTAARLCRDRSRPTTGAPREGSATVAHGGSPPDTRASGPGTNAARLTPSRPWPDGPMHPLLAEQLRGLGLTPEQAPSVSAWERVLINVNATYESGPLNADEEVTRLDALAELHGELVGLARSEEPADWLVVDAVIRDHEVAVALVSAEGLLVRLNLKAEEILDCPEILIGRPLADALLIAPGPGRPMLDRASIGEALRAGRTLVAAQGRVGMPGQPSLRARWRLSRFPTPDGGQGAILLFEALTHTPTGRRQATQDAATGLPNQRSLHRRLMGEVDRAWRSGRPLSMAILDLDGLRTVNADFGTAAGDLTVRRVADALGEQVLPGSFLARASGGTFALILPGVDAVAAYTIAERARAAAAAATVEAGVGVLTLSVGVCDLRHADTATELFQKADAALWWAKAGGRDRTVRYSSDIEERLGAVRDGRRDERMRTLSTIRALARAVDAKDPSTLRHSERVASLAVRIAGQLGWPATKLSELGEAALVHDVGKIGVPDALLFKPGPLTGDEYEVVKQHARLGARIVEGVLDDEQARWVLHHHEAYDGRGYPDGLAGEEIEEGAQIIAISDAYDSMVSTRPYRSARSQGEALSEFIQEAGRQFAPRLVEVLVSLAEDGALNLLPSEPVVALEP